MKKFAIALCANVLAATSVFAGNPVSIVLTGEGQDERGAYEIYEVRCSSGDEESITRWKEENTWCVGDASSDDCASNKMRAAKMACR